MGDIMQSVENALLIGKISFVMMLLRGQAHRWGRGNIWRKGAACFPEKTELAGGEVIFTEKEQLYYLINGVLDGSYQVKIFCSEFTRIYDLEVDYEQLSELENKEFGDLCEMVGRFSADEEELKIPNMFFSEESILNKAKYVKQLLE